MSKKIIIAHIHVWDKTNKGDLGIVIAVQDLLRETFKDLKIVDFPMEVLKSYNKKELEKINSADLIVIGGGGVLYRYFLPFSSEMIEGIKKPLIFFGVGYIREVGSKFMLSKEIETLKLLANKALFLGVRDYYTRQFLLKNNIPATKIDVIGDPAIFLQEKQNDFILSDRIKIGVNLNYSGWLGFGVWQKDILKAYQEIINYFRDNFDAEIYYLKHHPGEDNIKDELGKNLTIIDFHPYQQKFFYSKLDLVVGMMLHSCVFSFAAGTPEINVAYDLRNKSFANFIGHPELVVDLKKLKSGQLLKTAIKVFENRHYYRQKFLKRREKIAQKQFAFLEKIRKITD
ncbi:MAG: polysaccharide pyruvyl transferase family protein [Planctomycetes bacterium]|nr:polysaccharide pyruvyl transferase family protein [Planctomycetota bacterium]